MLLGHRKRSHPVNRDWLEVQESKVNHEGLGGRGMLLHPCESQ